MNTYETEGTSVVTQTNPWVKILKKVEASKLGQFTERKQNR